MKPIAILAMLPLLAASAGAATLWTSTFTGTDNTARTVINTPDLIPDTLTSTITLVRNTATGNPYLTGTENGLDNFNPNQNVDNDANAGWNAIFTYDGGSSTVALETVTFSIYRYNAGGNLVTPDTLERFVNITAEYTSDGSTWEAISPTQLVNLTPSDTDNRDLLVNFSFDTPLSVDLATDDFAVRYTVLNDDQNVGAFNGITSITFQGIPEPSVALLGALGALGLLRRRRA